MVTKLQHGAGRSFDVAGIVAFFGGRQQLADSLKKFKIVKITPAAIAKWMIRKDIPAARRDDLQTLARMKGATFDMASFMRPAKPSKKAG